MGSVSVSNLALLPFVLLFAWTALMGLNPPRIIKDIHRVGIKDMAGRVAAVTPPAQRVVSVAPILADYLTVDQSSSHVVGMARPSMNGTKIGILPKLYPLRPGMAITSPTVTPTDPEIFYALHADAVFSWAQFSESLRTIDLAPLVQITQPGRNFSLEAARWRLIGKVAGKPARAEELLQSWVARRNSLEKQLRANVLKPVRVAILNQVLDSFVLGSGRGFYLNGSLEFAGGHNAAESLVFSNVPAGIVEQLLLLDPDMILLNSGADYPSPEELYQAPEFQTIRAVRERKVYTMPLWYLSGSTVVETPLLLQWMAELIHPEAVRPELRAAYKDTYKLVYNYQISEDEIDRAILFPENNHSAGYQRFSRAAAEK